MRLHDINQYEEPEDEEEGGEEVPDEIPTCRECGSHSFRRMNYGEYSEVYYISFREEQRYPEENWNDMEQEMNNSDPFECTECGLEVTPNTEEQINNLR